MEEVRMLIFARKQVSTKNIHIFQIIAKNFYMNQKRQILTQTILLFSNSRWTSCSGFFQKNFNRRFTTKINSFAIITQSAYYKHTSKKFQRVPTLQASLATPAGPTPLPTSAAPTSTGHL